MRGAGIRQVQFHGDHAVAARSQHCALAYPARDARDLFIAANNGHVLAFDNVSRMPDWISDTLCRLSTGGGFATRQLYTNQDEVLFDAARPVILNGIEDMVRRPDLADRGLFLTLEAIPENRRRPQAELRAAFKAERPRILGVLLDAVVEGLKRLPTTCPPKLPRMADFALWATACETALWPAGTFEAAYNSNRDEAIEAVIEADPVADAVRTLTQTRTVWTGTATELLDTLTKLVMTELPGPRAGRIALRPCRAECAVRQQSCERAASRLSSLVWEGGALAPSSLPIPILQPSATGKGPSAPSAPSAHRHTCEHPRVMARTYCPNWGSALLRTVRTRIFRSNLVLENRPRRDDCQEPTQHTGKESEGQYEPTRKRI